MGTSATATRSKACPWRPPMATPCPLNHHLHPNRAPPCPHQQLTKGGPPFPPRCPWVGRGCPRTAVHFWSPWGQCRTPGCPGWRATMPPCFSSHARPADHFQAPSLEAVLGTHCCKHCVRTETVPTTTTTTTTRHFGSSSLNPS